MAPSYYDPSLLCKCGHAWRDHGSLVCVCGCYCRAFISALVDDGDHKDAPAAQGAAQWPK
jgi:hypothetical protein